MGSFWRQTKYLLYRNFLLKIRDNKTLFQEVFIPCVFIFSVMGVTFSSKPQVFSPITYDQFSNYPLLMGGNASFLPNTSRPWAFTPNTSSTQEVINAIKTALGDSGPTEMLAFADEDEMVRAYRSQQEPQFSTGIVFTDFPQNQTIVIRMPYEAVPNSDVRFTTQASCRTVGDLTPGLASYNCPANRYLFSGFATLQTVLQNVVSSLLTGQSFPLPDISIRMFPKGAHVEASPATRLVSAMYYVIAFSIFIAILLGTIVYEKEKKIKEAMLMMGLLDGAFWLAWFITYSVIMVIVAVVIALLSKFVVQLTPNGNFLIVFLILFCYGMSIISLAFMLTPFFNKATAAAVGGSIFTLLLSLIYIPLGLLTGVDTIFKWLLSFLCPIGFALAIDQAVILDQEGVGIQWDNMGLDGFPPYVAMLAIDAVLYLLLAFYFDNVVPGNYGQHKPLYFFLMPSYWCKRPQKHEVDFEASLEALQIEQEDVEPVSQEMRERARVRIHGLSKTFKGGRGKPDVHAVRGLSLDIYEGQITCLLGHNGAGKTTLINTLTGLIRADSGQATIYGHNVRDPIQMHKIREMMGVCSQDNTLFEPLSPREHLKVYAGLKGVPEDEIDAQVEKTLKLTQLAESATTKATDLSGGQKRKLCVGIALIGDPKILFLDEPSSGMDPFSRRQLWNLLKSQRQGRITVLTTHFMDEADILADRKAMMSQGSLRCYGSSLFLKTRFGIGYHLGMVVEPDTPVERITELVTTHVPNGKLSRSHGMEVAYTLPLQDTNRFPDLFKALEDTTGGKGDTLAKQLGIQSYGVSMTTLEEVFLKLSDEEKDDKEEAVVNDANDTSPLNQNADNQTPVPETGQPSLDVDHLLSKPLEPSKYQIRALCKVLFIQMLRDPATYVSRLVFPVIYMVLGNVLSTFINFGAPTSQLPASLALEPTLYIESSTQSSLSSLSPLLYQDNLTSGESIQLLVDQFDSMNLISEATTNMSDLMSLAPHSMATVASNLGTNNGTPEFLALYNDTAQHSLPVLLGLLSNALVPLETAAQSVLNMTIASHPLPARAVSYGFNSGFFLFIFFPMAINLLPMGFVTNVVKEPQEKVRTQLRVSGVTATSYWASHFLIDIVQMYFIAVIGIIIIVAIGLSAGGSSLTMPGGIFMFILCIIIDIPVATLFSYCIAFLFQDYKTSQAMTQLIYIYGALLLAVPTILLDFLASSAAAGALHLLFCIIFPPYAMYGTIYFIDKVYRVALAMQTLDQLTFGDYFAFDTFLVPSVLCVLVSSVLVFFLLRFLEIVSTGGDWRDTFIFSPRKVGVLPPNSDHIENEDSDVTAERNKVQEIFSQGLHPEKCVMAALGIRKEFRKNTNSCCKPKKPQTPAVNVAVRNLTLSVNEGEVMGLLGPNGAGKTTSMNVITADTKATRGQVQIAGYDITSSLSEAFRVFGFCPQHDPLYEHITMREHIETYAMIKGIHPDDVKAVAEQYMEALRVTEHADKKSQTLSGGTKRKLCFAMSMLGKPKIVFMDEPSTGMDPTSKRFVWNTIISSFRDERGAILTTHSMEEADAVCSRVGIMVSGKLVCLGTTQHLKGKYGGGYVLEVKLNPGQAYYSMDHTSGQATQLLDQHVSALDRRIKEVFPSAEVTEKFGERITYRIPSEAEISLSSVFAALEQGKETLHIEEYSFSQATLEQVFIEFAKTQREDRELDSEPSSPRRGEGNDADQGKQAKSVGHNSSE